MAAKAETIRLIRTKLNPPRVTDALVRRPRLIELLDTQPERPLTLVVASAGYGKTTLVSSWLQAQHYRNCWLSLDEYDNDLGTFLAYLTAAIRRAYPDSCRLTSDLLQGVSLPHTQTIASSLIDDLEILPQPLVLVLDDYHTIREPAINELFSVLLRYPPESLRLVLISRRDPLLPLARLRARGELAEVRARDLRFTKDEVAALVRLSPFADVDDAGVESLEEGTEGWITGLRLALLSRQREPDAGSQEEPLPSQGKYLADYLMSEMFADQPADIQDFLVRTSLFERFSAPLCETALGSDGPLGGFQSFLTSPSAANLFVVSLDMQDQWFRHHHLVQRFLQMQARTRLSACEISDLHERAAEWFSAEGLIDEALRHFLAAGDPDGAARLLVNQRHLLMSRGYWSGIVRYLTMLPDEVVEQEPELLIQKAWIKRIQWRSTSMQPDLARAEALLETSQLGESAQRSLRGEIDALNATPTLSDGSAQDAIPLLESAVKAIDPEHSYVRGYAMMLLANAYQLNGTADAAVALLMEAARDPLADTQLQLRLWSALSLIHYLQADLNAAWLAGTRYNEISRGRAEEDGMKWGEYRLACVAYFRDELTVAEQSFRACSDRPRAVHTMSTTNTAIGLAMTYESIGRSDQAREIAERNVSVLEGLGHKGLRPLAEAFRAELAARQGRMTDALQWIPSANLVPMHQEYIGFYAPQLALPKILLVENTRNGFQRARDILSELRELMECIHNRRFLIEVLALQALAHGGCGDLSRARDDISYALRLAEPGGFLRPFLDLGPDLLSLLKELALTGSTTGYLNQIINAFADSSSSSDFGPTVPTSQPSARRSHPELIESLTNREMDVLMLLADRLTNKEIALELGISSGTVKQHTINLYRKLYVSNRRQAANAARALGIL